VAMRFNVRGLIAALALCGIAVPVSASAAAASLRSPAYALRQDQSAPSVSRRFSASAAGFRDDTGRSWISIQLDASAQDYGPFERGEWRLQDIQNG
jgi:hypothetical protein